MKKILGIALVIALFLTSTATSFAYWNISSQYKYSKFTSNQWYTKFASFKEQARVSEFDPLHENTEIILPDEVQLALPFQPQAPYGQWIPPYDEACEEASLIMIDYYFKNKSLSSDETSSEILSMIEWEDSFTYGIDIGTTEMKNIIENYYNKKAKIYYDNEITTENLKLLLTKGYPLIIPVAGQYLGNPNFKMGGPPYHVIVLTGYNELGFYSHDPGTSFGEHYFYSYDILPEVIHDWTGSKSTILEGRKAIIVMGV